jgi:hypothetical protein
MSSSPSSTVLDSRNNHLTSRISMEGLLGIAMGLHRSPSNLFFFTGPRQRLTTVAYTLPRAMTRRCQHSQCLAYPSDIIPVMHY